jgi:4,5-DOPA dioxygenase extradiol
MDKPTDRPRLPSVFISHGAPTLVTDKVPAHQFLGAYGERLGKPTAIVVLSAHFPAIGAAVTAAENPATIHDFGGFPDELYAIEYPAPGDPQLASAVAGLLQNGGIGCRLDATRGFDHGTWVPLLLMYPDADIPVVQVSHDPRRGTDYHYRLGQLLSPLRDEGVLIIGSGGATHNLAEVMRNAPDAPTPEWAATFDDWLAETLHSGNVADLLRYREVAPYAARNHPTEEHLLPVVFALGAGGAEPRGQRVHHSFTYSSLSMDVFEFGGTA